MKNNNKKMSSGITLIALVITIMVLLILAGISIQMLSGDNGILQRATEAKTNTERISVIEQAQTDILGQIAENKGGKITEDQLKSILGTYFEEFDDELPENIAETNITLTAKETYGGYTNIPLTSIYNGKILKVVNHTYHLSSPDILNSNSVSWKVYLYDENDNIVPIIESYNVEITPSLNLQSYNDDGSINVARQRGSSSNYVVTLTINGQEVSETFMVLPIMNL